jgi:hypothetical protein
MPSPGRRGLRSLPRIVSSFAQVLSLEHKRFLGRMQGRMDLPGGDACFKLACPGEDGERGSLRHLWKVVPDASRAFGVLRGAPVSIQSNRPGCFSAGGSFADADHVYGLAGRGLRACHPHCVPVRDGTVAGRRGAGSTFGSEASWCAVDCLLAGSVHCLADTSRPGWSGAWRLPLLERRSDLSS